jgi:hypothetical protein
MRAATCYMSGNYELQAALDALELRVDGLNVGISGLRGD